MQGHRDLLQNKVSSSQGHMPPSSQGHRASSSQGHRASSSQGHEASSSPGYIFKKLKSKFWRFQDQFDLEGQGQGHQFLDLSETSM